MKPLAMTTFQIGFLAALICMTNRHAIGIDGCQCGLCTEQCNTCCLKCECKDDKKTGFDVECKTICIPKVVFPWQKKCNPCANNGACVRVVRVLKTKEVKGKKMAFEWTPAMIGGCGCRGCDCCDSGCCDSGACLASTNRPMANTSSGIRQMSSQQPVDMEDHAAMSQLQKRLLAQESKKPQESSKLVPTRIQELLR